MFKKKLLVNYSLVNYSLPACTVWIAAMPCLCALSCCKEFFYYWTCVWTNV